MLAQRFGVSAGAVCDGLIVALYIGRRGPRPHGGKRRALGGATPQTLAALVAERGDLYLTEYARCLAERTGTAPSSAAAICRALARLGLPRKKNAPRQ